MLHLRTPWRMRPVGFLLGTAPVLYFDPKHGTYQEETGTSATTPAVPGDPVGTWRARTGQYATALSASTRPVLQAGANNGNTVLRYDGGDDVLQVAGSFIMPSTQWTVILVYSGLPALASGVFFKMGSEATGGYGCGAGSSDFDNDGANLIAIRERIQWHGLGSGANGHLQQGVFQAVSDGTTINHWRNGIALGSVTAVFNNPSPLALGLFGYPVAYPRNLQGDLGDFLVWDRALTTAERQDVVRALQAKWKVE